MNLFKSLLLFIIIGFIHTNAFGQTKETSEVIAIKKLTNEWNQSINTRDTGKLSVLYADSVWIYGAMKVNAAVLSDKMIFLKKHPDFKQDLGDISVTKLSSMLYKASFSKQSSFAGKTQNVNGYLNFKRIDHQWKIIIESDDITNKNLIKHSIGTVIDGDFDGDGVSEKTSLKVSTKGEGDDEMVHISISFSSSKVKPLNIDPNREDIYLINEGDLNNIPGDEITVYGPPLHGCTYSMDTYTYANGAWKLMMEPFLIPTACDEMSDHDLQNRIFKEGNIVYFYDTDVNDEHFKLIKKKAKLQ